MMSANNAGAAVSVSGAQNGVSGASRAVQAASGGYDCKRTDSECGTADNGGVSGAGYGSRNGNHPAGLNVSYIDGPDRTLAYASFQFYSSGRPVGMGIRVDAADFNAADAQGTGRRSEALRSTVAHELMHSVMQYTLTDGMSGRKGYKYPTWFVEGTAQLAGGGFATG